MLTLRPYQQIGVDFCTSMNASLLCDSMGLGKSVTAIRCIQDKQPCLIICPKSMKETWRRLAEDEGIQARVLEGRQECWQFPNHNEIIILNPEIMPKRVDVFGVPFRMLVIVDELHCFKNPKLERTGNLYRLNQTVQALQGRTIGMTGSPILSSPYDLYGVLFACNLIKDTYKSFSNFCKEFGRVQLATGKEVWRGPQNLWSLEPLKKVMLRRLRHEVAKDIPAKTYQDYEVKIPNHLLAPKEGFANCNMLRIDDEIDSILTSHKVTHLMTWRRDVEVEKMKASIDLIEDMAENTPIVVFCTHKESAELLGSRPRWGMITGETPAKQRQQLVDAHQAGQLKGLVGTIGAMGVGLTLTVGNQVVMVSRDWQPAMNSQAEDRVCRMGQNRGVVVTDIVSQSKIDSRINFVLRKKQNMINEIIEVKQ